MTGLSHHADQFYEYQITNIGVDYSRLFLENCLMLWLIWDFLEWLSVDAEAAEAIGQALDQAEGVQPAPGLPGLSPDALFFDYVGFYEPNKLPADYEGPIM